VKRYCYTGRNVVVSEGMAIWTLPSKDGGVVEQEKNAKIDFMQNLLGADYDSYVKINEFMSSKTQDKLFENAWYLSILGITPAHQRRGIGTRLLADTLQQADEAGVACFLETFDDNKGFYEKFGFKSAESYIIPHINAEYTIMIRPAP
jgi:ribosomal protein S18 acetylase RimI-like enzyme